MGSSINFIWKLKKNKNVPLDPKHNSTVGKKDKGKWEIIASDLKNGLTSLTLHCEDINKTDFHTIGQAFISSTGS